MCQAGEGDHVAGAGHRRQPRRRRGQADPAIFDHALPYFEGIDRQPRSRYVGDSVTMDVGGARAAGLHPILLDPYDDHPDADFERIRSLTDLTRTQSSFEAREFERRHGERPLVAVACGERSRRVLLRGGDVLEASGQPAHGEADFIESLHPPSVLDAGCGMGRVAIELARRGIDVVGVDLDDELLEYARRSEPSLRWVHADLLTMRLDRSFDVVAMPGNVMVFCRPSDRSGIIRNCSAHLEPSGLVGGGISTRVSGRFLETLRLRRDVHMTAASNWPSDGRHGSVTRTAANNYAVSVHRRV